MPYIDVIPLKRATGLLKKQYEAALARAGRIWGKGATYNGSC